MFFYRLVDSRSNTLERYLNLTSKALKLPRRRLVFVLFCSDVKTIVKYKEFAALAAM